MESKSTSDVPANENRARLTLRGLRPLVWWTLLVLGMYGYHKHQELLERTRLRFTVSLEGRPVPYEVSATVDGSPASSGQRIGLGRHEFVVSHPKAEPFATNLFIWYGEHDLGGIVLKRAKGILQIQVNPPATLILIQGPEFNLTLTNSSGMTSSVPADRYTIEARYSHWEKTQNVNVGGGPAFWAIAPPLGALQVSSSHVDTSFQLLSGSDVRPVQSGELPCTVEGLPEGNYRLIAQHRGDRQEQEVVIAQGKTNTLRVKFVYGAASLRTDPVGASVVSRDGRDWGITPLFLAEIKPGSWEFTLRRQGYEPAQATLEITANQTNAFHTNLISTSYLGAMGAARNYLAARDYNRALEAAGEAIRIQPSDSAATALQGEASARSHLAKAKVLGERAEYVAAMKELESALSVMPDNPEAKELRLEYARRQQELAGEADAKRQRDLAEKQRQTRLNRPIDYFEEWMKTVPNSTLFDQFALTVKGDLPDVEARVVKALTNGQPAFKLGPVNTN